MISNKKSTTLILIVLLILTACSKDDRILPNDSLNYIVEGSFGSPITRGNQNNRFTINIDITNPKSNQSLPTIVHTFISNDVNDDISDLRENFHNFSGVFERRIEGKLLSIATIEKGEVISFQKFELVFSGDYDCTIDGITTCADDTINEMNWVEYAFCAATAPMCLARIYASCIYENC